MSFAKHVCKHCGGLLVYTDGRPVCHNDTCDLNRDTLRRNDIVASVGTGIGMAINLGCLSVVVALVAGAAYGLWLLLS